MHLLIPHCSSPTEPGQHALKQLRLPHLTQLMKRLTRVERNAGDEWTLNAPHERVLAQSLGWQAGDGRLPFAAWELSQDGGDPGLRPWGLLTPVHWMMGRDHLTALPPSVLAIQADESRALFESARSLFVSDGWDMRWHAPDRWYVSHESLADLPTASLDRVSGRNPDAWMPDHPQARWIKRLQNEVQMLWYQHPVNEARESRRQLTINTLWLSGCGVHQAPSGQSPQVITRLREPLWQEDWQAWVDAWHELDRTLIRDARESWSSKKKPADDAFKLTLAGERHAQSYSAAGRAWWQGLSAPWKRVDVLAELASL